MKRILGLTTAALIITGFACEPGSTFKDRRYSTVFLWLKNPAKFREYGRLVGPIAAAHGGRIERMIIPAAVHGKGLKKPDLVNIVYFPSREAEQRFEQDPAFLKIKPLRDEAADMIAVSGRALGGSVNEADVSRRFYMLEMVAYKNGDRSLYESYLSKAMPVLRKHGLRVERTLKPLKTIGNLPRFDLINVLYYESEKGMKAMEKDPAHGEIEKLYPASVEKSIWIMGKARAMR